MNASTTALPNSITEIQKRVAAGKITWIGPLMMLSARTVFGWIAQALVAVLFFRGSADAWKKAGEWWPAFGTLIDVGCIITLLYLTRREGIRLFDLGKYRRERWLRDVLIGLGLFVPMFLGSVGLTLGTMALLGYTPPTAKVELPTWGILYSLIIWPIIWAPTEDNTYAGYSLPRVEALTGKKWLAVVVVGFFGVLQHLFVPWPVVLDWRPFVGWIVGLVPSTAFLYWVYYRLVDRRLLPGHVAHWLSDVVAFAMLFLPPLF